MADTVSIDYANMQKVAQGFSHEAAHVKKVLSDIQHQVDILKHGGWIADAANKFYGVMDNDLCPRLQRLTNALEHTANHCSGDITQTFKNATDEACNAIPNS